MKRPAVMNSIALPTQTMTSREIAELVDSRHDSVKRAIERLAEKGAISQPPLVDGPRSPNGVVEKHYLIGKRDSYVIVAQLSPSFTARLVDRWQELEAQASPPAVLNLRDPRQLAAAALQLIEVNQELQTQVESMKVTVAAHDRIAVSDGASCITDTAKTLQMRPKDLFAWLKENRWIYRRPGGSGWLGYQPRVQQGLLEHKITTVEQSDGSFRGMEQVRITRKGLAYLAEQFSKEVA